MVLNFLAQPDKSFHHYVLEVTSHYVTLLVEMLLATDLSVSVINPRQIKHLAKVVHHIAKTDKVDAQLKLSNFIT